MAAYKQQCPRCGEEITGTDEASLNENVMKHLNEKHDVDITAEQIEVMMKQMSRDHPTEADQEVDAPPPVSRDQ